MGTRLRTPRAGGFVAALLLTVPVLPALGAPTSGGVQGSVGQNTNSGPGVGPSSPGIDWQRSLPDYVGGRAQSSPILDSEGHVIIGAREAENTNDREHHVVALDLSDGSVAWDIEGVDGDCTPAATQDGQLFAMGELDGGGRDLVRIDATDGTILERLASDPDGGTFGACTGTSGMRLAADDVLLIPNSANFQPRLSAFTTAGSLAFAWEYLVPHNFTAGQVVVSPDGAVAFVTWYDDDTEEFVVASIDTADGSELDVERLALNGATRGGSFRIFAHDGGGVLVGYAQDPVLLTRLASTAGGALSHDWTTAFSRFEELDESGYGSELRQDQFALTDTHVVFRISADLVGVNLDTGQVDWVFTLKSFNNSTVGVYADANGDLYAPTFGSSALQSVTSLGEARWATEEPDQFWGTFYGPDTLGPITDDGKLLIWGQDADSRAVVTSVVNSATRLIGEQGDTTPITVAIQTCQYLFPEDDSAQGVLLARDDVFADALAGAPLAGDVQCILYTPGGPGQSLDPRTRTEIDRVLASGAPVTILGGTNAVSAEVASELDARGYDVTRLSGASRFETAIAIARQVRAANPDETRTALAFAFNWPDAVTGGAWAAVEGIPVVLTEKDQLTPATDAELDRLGTESTIVFGGQGVISDAAANAAPSPSRYFGRNRYATAADVAARLWASVPNQGGAFVLTNLHHEHGWAFSLSAVPVSVRLVAPQLGVQATEYPEDTKAYLQSRGFDTPAGLVVLGDVSVISDGVVEQVSNDVGQ